MGTQLARETETPDSVETRDNPWGTTRTNTTEEEA